MPVLPSHIETNQLICTANQLTGFYVRKTLGFNGLITENIYLPFSEELCDHLCFVFKLLYTDDSLTFYFAML